MLRMRDYTESSREALARAGRGGRRRAAARAAHGGGDRRADRPARRLPDLHARRLDETKFPSNYHWPSDTPDNLSWESVEGALRVCEAYVREPA